MSLFLQADSLAVANEVLTEDQPREKPYQFGSF